MKSSIGNRDVGAKSLLSTFVLVLLLVVCGFASAGSSTVTAISSISRTFALEVGAASVSWASLATSACRLAMRPRTSSAHARTASRSLATCAVSASASSSIS